MNIVIMITGSIVGCAYITELFIAWYSGVEYEQYAFLNRATGPYWWAYLLMMSCNVFSPQFMWFKKLRTSIMFSFIISIVVNIGMWFERFVIIVTSLHRGHMPASWSMFYPTWVDIGVFIGTLGIFTVLYLLYARYFPVLAISEVKTILKSSGENYKEGFALFLKAPTAGHGYNNLFYVRSIKNQNSHANSGFDSSLMTILTTTGCIGAFLFILGFKKTFNQGNLTKKTILLSIFFHSLFANSLIYPWVFLLLILMQFLIMQLIKNISLFFIIKLLQTLLT
jgi:hypothetical protein